MDNGVSLRLRRQVTAINQDDSGSGTGTLVVHMDHWEPAAYIHNKPNESTLSSPSSSSHPSAPLPASTASRIATVVAASIALCLIFISLAHVVVGIPSLSHLLSRAQAAACAFVVAFSFVAVLYDGPAAASHLRLKSSGAADGKTSASAPVSAVGQMAKTAPISVGSGGDCVPVAEMALGGSGFLSAVGGSVVEKETVRTR